MKLNSITTYKIIDKLYQASTSGVKIDLIVRGVCCLIPGINGLSENIKVISVIDKFLEHSRVYIFENGGNKKIYLSSSDLMTRSFDNRVVVTFPIYSRNLQNQIIDTFNISWTDNVKARLINTNSQNIFITNKKKKNRSQEETFNYYSKDFYQK